MAGVDLQVYAGGSGEPLLLLHDIEYALSPSHRYLQALAERYAVTAPAHPGFGTSDLPADFDSVDDLAYVYLELVEQVGAPVHLVGLGLGGWIAAEVAIRCQHDLKSLTLVDAVGIKVGDRTTRDIADPFSIGPEEYLRLSWHDPAAGERTMRLPGLGDLSEEELVLLLRGRQSATLLTWRPFMHAPRLRSRLRRIHVPTLVLWGASDAIVSPAYGQAYADAIPGARFQVIPQAGHYPYLEQPEAFVQAVEAFLGTPAQTPDPRVLLGSAA